MKKTIYFVICSLLALGMILGACSPAAPAATKAPEAQKPADGAKPIKIVNLINGVLGDKSFFDSANRGMEMVKKDYPNVTVKTIEAGIDPAKWQAALEDAAANEEYDLMILGTYQMSEFLEMVAPKYPDKKFIIYDVGVDYTKAKLDNVYSVTYKQNEGSYLAGVYAGLMSKSHIIGVIGGQDIPVINDFIVGYKQGATANGVTNVITQYAGGWNDPAKGKELALAMYQQGADIVFQVAGGTGVGVFQAAQEMKKLAIGVDSDQAMIINDTNPDQAKFIATSMMKNVDKSLYRAVKMYIEGTLPFGKAEALGVAEEGVGLATNKIFDELTPADVKTKLEAAIADVKAGKVQIDTAIK